MLVCKICNKRLKSMKSLSMHVNVHDIDKKGYTIDNFYGGEVPVCKCGCGQPTRYRCLGSFAKYVSGHNGRVFNGFKGKHHTKATIDHIQAIRKEKLAYRPKTGTYQPCLQCGNPIYVTANYGIKKFCERKCFIDYKKIVYKLYGTNNIYFKSCSKGGTNSRPNWKNSKEELKVKKILQDLNIQFFHQHQINIDNNKYYIVDFYLPERNIILEVDGDYWHCNPKLYDKEYYHSKIKLTAENIWRRDTLRSSIITNTTKIPVKRIYGSNINKYNINSLISQ